MRLSAWPMARRCSSADSRRPPGLDERAADLSGPARSELHSGANCDILFIGRTPIKAHARRLICRHRVGARCLFSFVVTDSGGCPYKTVRLLLLAYAACRAEFPLLAFHQPSEQ